MQYYHHIARVSTWRDAEQWHLLMILAVFEVLLIARRVNIRIAYRNGFNNKGCHEETATCWPSVQFMGSAHGSGTSTDFKDQYSFWQKHHQRTLKNVHKLHGVHFVMEFSQRLANLVFNVPRNGTTRYTLSCGTRVPKVNSTLFSYLELMVSIKLTYGITDKVQLLLRLLILNTENDHCNLINCVHFFFLN